LLLRPWKEDDAEALYKYASDPEVGPRAGWPPHKSVEESREIIRTIFSSDHNWAVELKETGEPIGCIGYFVHGESNINIGENDAEVGYWIARPYWNKGICSEALQKLVDFCFNEKGFQTLWSDYFPENPASGRVMEKCGFRDTGEINYCSRLQVGSDRPVKIMRLDRMKHKILFVCHGNICRSPMAEFVMKHLVEERGLQDQFEIASAATSTEEIGNPVYPPARRKLAEHGIECQGKTARQMTMDDYRYYDYIIVMDRNNIRNLKRLIGEDSMHKIHLLMDYTNRPGEVADPWYTGDFEATWKDVLEGCEGFVACF